MHRKFLVHVQLHEIAQCGPKAAGIAAHHGIEQRLFRGYLTIGVGPETDDTDNITVAVLNTGDLVGEATLQRLDFFS